MTLLQADVASVVQAVERDRPRRLVGELAGLVEIVADAGHVQDPATVGQQLAASTCGTGVEDERAERLGVRDSGDRRAYVTALRVRAGGQRNRDRGTVTVPHRSPAQVSAGGRDERREQVAVEAGEDCLRLRVAEAAVELE